MKRFLLFAMMCACATIGAWADATLEVDDDKNFVFTTNGDGDLTTITDWLSLKGDGSSEAQSITVIGSLTSTGFAEIINRINPYGTGGYQTKIDLSQADMEEFSLPNTTNLGYIYKLILPQGISIPDDYSNGSTLNVYNNLKTIYAFDGTTVTVVIVDANNPVSASTAISDTQHYTNPTNYQVLCSDNAKAETLTAALKDEGISVIEPAKPPYILNGCQLEITMPADGSGDLNAILADALSKVDESLFPYKELCELVINGPIKTTDLTCNSFKTVNCVSVDFSGATFLDDNGDVDCSIISSATADNIRYVIMPEGTPSSVMKNTSFTGFTKFDAAGTLEELKDESDAGRGKYSLTATVKNEGILFEITSRMRKLGSTPSISTTSSNGQTVTSSIAWSPNVNNLEEIHLNGNLNFRDIAQSNTATVAKLPADGHLYFNEDPVEGLSQATRKPISQDLNNQTQEVKDAYTVSTFAFDCNTMGIKVVDLAGAEFSHIEDMTLIYTGLLGQLTTKVVIPTTSSVKELPADFLNTASINIRSICIPSNIEVIRTRAFLTIDYVWTTSGTNDPEGQNTKLDNGVKYKETDDFVYATETADFDYTKAPSETEWGGGTYTFSSNLKLIETAAFANSRPHVKDVYVLNTVAPECHVDAFNTAMYLGNGGYKSEIIDGIITRDGYRNNGTWITMLHYPRQTKTPEIQRYTDPTREYSVATGQRDGKGATLYFPNQSEFIRAYMQGTYGYTWKAWDPTRTYGSVDNAGLHTYTTSGWLAAGQAAANGLYNSNETVSVDEKKFYTFYDVSLGDNTKPETLIDYYLVQYGGGNYTVAATQGNLYPKANETNTALNEVTERDYRGWHQFVLTEYAANTTLQEEPYRSYITDNEWWTICPTFDITREEASILFGVRNLINTTGPTKYPYVSKLRYVRRDYSRQTIYLNFSQDLTQHEEDRLSPTDKHGANTARGYVNVLEEAPNEKDIVMSAGVPYLIKPAISPGAYRQFRIFPNENELNKFIAQFSSEEWTNRDFVAFPHETLYNKLKEAEAKTGSQQMADVHQGIYTVPVYVSEADGSGLEKESVGDTQFTIGDLHYYMSKDWKYSFVGTFYKSFMPHYCYFLGWDSSLNNGQGAARFWYHNGNFEWHDNNMNWNNETGVICPIYQKESFDYKITEAHEDSQQGTVPAQWDLKDKFVDDSFIKKSTGAPAKSYDMIIDSPEVLMENMGITTVIEGFDNYVEPELVEDIKVYNLEGQFVGNSKNGLAKGVYVVNGKKCVIR